MASDVASASVNGNYAPHPVTVYGNSDKSYSLDRAGSDSSTNNYDAANSTDANSVRPENGAPAISKAEVGWFFVEQYYLTLSRSPEKLYVSILQKSSAIRILAAAAAAASSNFVVAILQQKLTFRFWRGGRESVGLCRSKGQ